MNRKSLTLLPLLIGLLIGSFIVSALGLPATRGATAYMPDRKLAVLRPLLIGLLVGHLILFAIGVPAAPGAAAYTAELVRGDQPSAPAATPQASAALVGTGFTYQGRLKRGGTPANGRFDLLFSLYDVPDGGALVATPISQPAQPVTEGWFAVTLDFGAGAFTGETRWLEILVRPTGSGAYTTLRPRQPI